MTYHIRHKFALEKVCFEFRAISLAKRRWNDRKPTQHDRKERNGSWSSRPHVLNLHCCKKDDRVCQNFGLSRSTCVRLCVALCLPYPEQTKGGRRTREGVRDTVGWRRRRFSFLSSTRTVTLTRRPFPCDDVVCSGAHSLGKPLSPRGRKQKQLLLFPLPLERAEV